MNRNEFLKILEQELYSGTDPSFEGLYKVLRGKSTYDQWHQKLHETLTALNEKYSILKYLSLPPPEEWKKILYSEYDDYASVREAVRIVVPTFLITEKIPVQGELF